MGTHPGSVAVRRKVALLAAFSLFAALVVTNIGAPQAVSDAGDTVQFASPSGSIAESGGTYTVDVEFTAGAVTNINPVEVTITPTSGNATGGGVDYTLDTPTVTFPPGSSSGAVETVSVSINSDSLDEVNETVTFTLSVTSGGGDPGTQATHTLTITDDDPTPSLSIADASLAEGNTGSANMQFTVSLSAVSGQDVTFDVDTTNGTATAGEDYTAVSTNGVTITAGNLSTIVNVPILTDTLDENNETFTVTLSNLDGATAGTLTATGTINDDDARPTISIDNASLTEQVGNMPFTVSLSTVSGRDVTFDVDTANGTATAGEDYTAVSTNGVTITAGNLSTTVNVPILEDSEVEGNETFTVTLSNLGSVDLGDGTATGTITDDDSAGVTIDVGDGVTVAEGSTTDTYTIVLTAQPGASVTVTPHPDAQVTVSPTSVSFTAANWDTPRTITVSAVADGTDEADIHSGIITHTTTSSDSAFNGLGVATVTADVIDSDALLVTVSGPSTGAPGTAATFVATVNAGGSGTFTYSWQILLNGVQQATGANSSIVFTPTQGGTYVVLAQVSDDNGQSPAIFTTFVVLGDIGDSIFSGDIVWLRDEGITLGCNPPTNDRFCPTQAVTRGQMAAFLVRFLGLTTVDSSIDFIDDDDSIFETDIAKLATAGITYGCNPPDYTMFCPNANVTRGQMAAFIHRAESLLP
jgi:hypothetical protein